MRQTSTGLLIAVGYDYLRASLASNRIACSGSLWTSYDSGATWTDRGWYGNWYSLACSDDGTRIAGASPNFGIFISEDSGVTWTPPAAFNERLV